MTDNNIKRYDDAKWWPTKKEYDHRLTKEDWLELLNDKEVFDKNSLITVKSILNFDGIASCIELSRKYGYHYGFYNIVSVKLAKRIIKKKGIKVPNPSESNSKYWPVLYYGQKCLIEEAYLYKLRDELKEALLEIDLSNLDLYCHKFKEDNSRNYFWLNMNPSIFSFKDCEVGDTQCFTLINGKGNQRRKKECFLKAKVGDFVFGYESTPTKCIVALCEISRGSNGENIEIKKVSALENPLALSEIQKYDELKDLEILQPAAYGTLFELNKKQYEFLISLIEEENPFNEQEESYTKEDFLNEVFMEESSYDKLYSLLKHKHNIIVQGVPGVGKTFISKKFAYSVLGSKKESNIAMVQFHQNFTYEDFVMGYRPDGDGFKLKPGIFYSFVKKARENPDEPYFFIIDEINRGNLSKIFGELLMLIEHDYRNTSIKLSYNEEEFSVPENLYIIGMMNTADRSLSLIDYALRRRFSFVNLTPAFDNETFKKYQESVDNPSFDKLIENIKSLNEEITSRLGKNFVIGHSYFVRKNIEEITNGYLNEVVDFDIIPLLEEYFFDENNDVISKWSKKLHEAINEE